MFTSYFSDYVHFFVLFSFFLFPIKAIRRTAKKQTCHHGAGPMATLVAISSNFSAFVLFMFYFVLLSKQLTAKRAIILSWKQNRIKWNKIKIKNKIKYFFGKRRTQNKILTSIWHIIFAYLQKGILSEKGKHQYKSIITENNIAPSFIFIHNNICTTQVRKAKKIN